MKTLLVSLGLLGLVFVPASPALGDAFLVGADLYASDSAGNNVNGGFQFNTNSSVGGIGRMSLDNGTGPQTTGISFALQAGANTFTLTPNTQDGADLGRLGGLVLFFNTTGVSFNPSPGSGPLGPDLAVIAPVNGGPLSFAALGAGVADFTRTFNQAPYSGATSFLVGGETVTVSAFSVNLSSQGAGTGSGTLPGSVTINVGGGGGGGGSTVPEPSTLVMWFAGLAGMVLFRRWKVAPVAI